MYFIFLFAFLFSSSLTGFSKENLSIDNSQNEIETKIVDSLCWVMVVDYLIYGFLKTLLPHHPMKSVEVNIFLYVIFASVFEFGFGMGFLFFFFFSFFDGKVAMVKPIDFGHNMNISYSHIFLSDRLHACIE